MNLYEKIPQEFERILIVGNHNLFEKNLASCLKHVDFKCYHCKFSDMISSIKHNRIDVVIFDGLNDFDVNEFLIDNFLEIQNLEVHKFIFLESGNKIYLNSENETPYSVYKKLIPANDICQKMLAIEDVISKLPNYVVFRISEIYGPFVKFGIIHNIASKKLHCTNLGLVDFIYEGDIISAIEIAIQADSIGIFDIASGKSISVEDVAKKMGMRITSSNDKNIIYNCDNFRFYKWEPLIKLDLGLKTTLKLKK